MDNHKVIEGIVVENDNHGFCIDDGDLQLNIPFNKIKLFAENGGGLSQEEQKIILTWWCRDKVRANIEHEAGLRKIKPIDWSKFAIFEEVIK